jgi:hypothetical protein
MNVGMLVFAVFCLIGFGLYALYKKGFRIDWTFFRR